MAQTPRALLDQLTSGQQLSGFPPEAVEQARRLAAAPAGAAAADVEALPELLALAVLEASVRARSPELSAALGGSRRKELARAARRALYKLRSAGVEVPEPTAPPPAASVAPAEEPLPATTTAMAGNGQLAVLIPRVVRGGVEGLEFFISDETGVLEVSRLDLSRGGFLKLLRNLRRDRRLPTVELTAEEARDEVAMAAGRNLATRTPFPRGLDVALRHLDVQPRQEEAPLPAPTPEDARLASEGAALHTEPEIAAWLPPQQELRVLAEKLQQVDTSPLALSDVQRAEHVEATLRAQAHAFFTEPMRRLYARRLWWMARFFERTGRAHVAEVARAEARRLFHGELAPYPRFAEVLFEKVVRPAAPGPGEGAGAAGEPATEPAAGTRPGERRSPGGIILP
jgi:hypothetical protein